MKDPKAYLQWSPRDRALAKFYEPTLTCREGFTGYHLDFRLNCERYPTTEPRDFTFSDSYLSVSIQAGADHQEYLVARADRHIRA